MPKETVNIQFPVDLIEKVNQLKENSESLAELVITAVERELARRRAIATHESIVARRNEIKSQTGLQTNSIELIRELRAGEGRSE